MTGDGTPDPEATAPLRRARLNAGFRQAEAMCRFVAAVQDFGSGPQPALPGATSATCSAGHSGDARHQARRDSHHPHQTGQLA